MVQLTTQLVPEQLTDVPPMGGAQPQPLCESVQLSVPAGQAVATQTQLAVSQER